MARTKSHEKSKEDTKPNRGPMTYPYVVYASWQKEGEDIRWLILKFDKAWGARNMIEGIKGDSTYEIVRGLSDTWDYMLLDNGIRLSLRNDELHKEVMELEFDEATAYKSPEVLWFRYRTVAAAYHVGEDGDEGTGPAIPASKKSRRDKPAKLSKKREGDTADKPERTGDKDSGKPARQKVDRDGKISANDIATELGVEGRDVRGVLRAMKLEKPAGGWLFDEKTADDIRAKVKANLKKKK